MLVDFYATLCSRSHARSPGVFQALTHCENEEEGIQPCIDQLGGYLVRSEGALYRGRRLPVVPLCCYYGI